MAKYIRNTQIVDHYNDKSLLDEIQKIKSTLKLIMLYVKPFSYTCSGAEAREIMQASKDWWLRHSKDFDREEISPRVYAYKCVYIQGQKFLVDATTGQARRGGVVVADSSEIDN